MAAVAAVHLIHKWRVGPLDMAWGQPVILTSRSENRRGRVMNQIQKKFEVAIFNELVKKSVREAEKNRTGLSDDWADVHYIEVRADTAEGAKSKLYSRFPQARGFVILEVREMP